MSVNVLPRLADRPGYRCRFSAEIELKREREREGKKSVRTLWRSEKKDFSQKSGPREIGCVKMCTLLILAAMPQMAGLLVGRELGKFSPGYARCCAGSVGSFKCFVISSACRG